MTQHRRLSLRLFLIGLVSGVGTGAALLFLARSGFGAILGDAGLYVGMAGAGWFTGQAIEAALQRHGVAAPAERERMSLPIGLAAGYALAISPLNALLVDALLTGDWLVPGLWLAAVCAVLGGGFAWALARRGVATRGIAVSASVAVLAMSAIVGAVNLLAWWGGRDYAGGDPTALMLAGVWAIYFVPALWLPALTHFCLKPGRKGAATAFDNGGPVA